MGGGGPSIFVQSLDLWALTASLAIVIAATVAFELAVHTCEHKFERHPLYGPMLQKVMAEFTVLGFVSICTILSIQSGLVAEMKATDSVAAFEVAHIWIFQVGCFYVVQAFQNVKVAGDLSRKAQARDMISKEDLLLQLQLQRLKGRQGNCCRRDRGRRQSAERTADARVDHPEWAASTALVGFFFKQAQQKRILHELGSRARLFDFATYEKHFFRHETLSSLHVSVLSWIGFYLLWVCWVGLRSATIGDVADKTVFEGPALAMWALVLLWAAFVTTVGIQADRLDAFVAATVTGDETKSSLCDALEHLVRLSENKATLDADGTLWAQRVAKPVATAFPEGKGRAGSDHAGSNRAGLGSVGSGVTGSENVELIPLRNDPAEQDDGHVDMEMPVTAAPGRLRDSKTQERQSTLQRLRSVKRENVRKIICCSSRVRQLVFNTLLFSHCYAYGMYIFLVMPEQFGYKQFNGRVPSQSANSTSLSSSAHSSSHSSSSGSHSRMLLSSTAASSSSSSSSSSGSRAGAVVEWKTCREFARAGAQVYGRTALGGTQYRVLDYQGRVGEDFICTIHSPFGTVLGAFCFLIPLVLVEQMMPAFLGAHSRQKYVMLACSNDDSDTHDGSDHHGHGQENLSHSGDHHAGHCCADLLFGHDHTDLNSIISEVCEKCAEQSRILEQVQNNTLRALQLYPEGFDDLRAVLGMRRKRSAPDQQESAKTVQEMVGQKVVSTIKLSGLSFEWQHKSERLMTKELSAMWEKDEANGWPKMKVLVRGFLELLREHLGIESDGGSATTLSATDFAVGLNLLYKFRLPESGCKLPRKSRSAFLRSLDRNFDGRLGNEEFQEFLIADPSRVRRFSAISVHNPAFDGRVRGLKESLRRASLRVIELENQLKGTR